MKKFLVISVLFFLAAASNILKAQNCDFAQTGVRYNSSYTDPSSGNCIINVDLYFDLRTNSGSKYVTMHIWPKAIYPGLSYDSPPDSVQLAGSATVVIHHFQDNSLAHVDTVYKPDPRVVTQYINMGLNIGPSTISNQYERFTVTNLNLEIPGGCGISQIFTMDVWATESESMNAVHCFNTGKDFFANNPVVRGLLYCQQPRTYNVQITSIDPVPMTVQYDVYIDNGDYIFNKTEDVINIKTQTGIVISSSSGYNSGVLSYLPYSNQNPYVSRNLWVEVTSPTLPNSVIYGIENACGALPVGLKLFTVKKTGESVQLNWITASESGNKGFYIERKTGNQEWQTIGFVNTLAQGGNSQSDLAYSFVDALFSKGIVQYRLKQMDLDGKSEYSPVRVINKSAGAIVIFPNPSARDVNIVFSDTQLKYEVTLYTADARMLKSWQNCNSVLQINGLKPGIYLLSIKNNNSREMVTRKIVVQ
jgi:hypothetical protein